MVLIHLRLESSSSGMPVQQVGPCHSSCVHTSLGLPCAWAFPVPVSLGLLCSHVFGSPTSPHVGASCVPTFLGLPCFHVPGSPVSQRVWVLLCRVPLSSLPSKAAGGNLAVSWENQQNQTTAPSCSPHGSHKIFTEAALTRL